MDLRRSGPTRDVSPASDDLHSTTRRVSFALPADSRAVGEARHLAREQLKYWGVGAEKRDAAALVVTELFTNALAHTTSDVVVCALKTTSDHLVIEVMDDGSGPPDPAPREAGAHDEHGRGLALVRAVSACWGAGPSGGGVGQAVWAVLPPAQVRAGTAGR
ncbi:ATP-binding protein [Streptomyces flavofungini]|uniref:ATP-binding protein n=1 Tax=Streptomyces flavofungini TaxID=68200 RepID=UPI0019A61BED|nr:ATP-binding protein [Streptomyces flavofungini]GHC54391.1 hypothetical protein GCM10010349_20950 [Streptomyces flavofungini]